MKAFSSSHAALTAQAGPILLLTEKLVIPGASLPRNNRDEHNQTDILTPGLKPHSRLPGFHQWPWELVTRYSGVTVPDSHGVPERLAVMADKQSAYPVKEHPLPTPASPFCQEKNSPATLSCVQLTHSA
jgi:hypothetical protein